MSSSLGSIDLPIDLQWIDEYLWSPVGQQLDIALAGSLIFEESKQLAGRLITLQGRLEGNVGFAAITREVAEEIRILAEEPMDEPILLTLHDGRTFDVMFRRANELPFEAAPIKHIVPYDDGDLYFPTIRLIQV